MTRKKKLMRTDMRNYLDVFRLCFEDQLSHRQIALALSVGRSTVTDLIARFNNLNLEWPLPPEVCLNKIDQALLPGRDYQTKRVLPDWLRIDLELKDPKLTKQLLWQEYQAEHGRAALGTPSSANITAAGKARSAVRCAPTALYRRETLYRLLRLHSAYCRPTHRRNPQSSYLRRHFRCIQLHLHRSLRRTGSAVQADGKQPLPELFRRCADLIGTR
uniref:Mobile element protein n=1 Tax=Rheinheimera sp. BAL341 TaxID=1708203 RepID=A0A486XPA9_9GAMM